MEKYLALLHTIVYNITWGTAKANKYLYKQEKMRDLFAITKTIMA